jgi:hypothetical protein
LAVLFGSGIDCLLVVLLSSSAFGSKVVIRFESVSFGAQGEYDQTQARATFLELERAEVSLNADSG